MAGPVAVAVRLPGAVGGVVSDGAAVDVHAGPGGVPGEVAGRHLVGVTRSRGGRLVRVAGHGGRDGRQVGAVAVDVVGRDPDVVRRRGPGEDVLRGTSGRFEAARRRGRRAVRREVVGLRVEGPAAGVDRRDCHGRAVDRHLQQAVHLRVAARGGGRAARRPLGAAVGPAHRVGVGGAALADRLRRGAAVAGDIIGYPARRGDVPLVDVRVTVERQVHAVARQQLLEAAGAAGQVIQVGVTHLGGVARVQRIVEEGELEAAGVRRQVLL